MAAHGGDYINGTDPYATPGGDDAYLSSLLSYSVSQLNKEPANLLEARTRAAAARKETAQKRYASFIAASELFAIVRREVADVEKGLDDLRSSLPALRNGCQTFAEEASAISRNRTQHRNTLANQSLLLDLLEAPALQDTCVRHGNYDEALEIESFLEKAANSHARRAPVLSELAKNASEASDVMLHQLVDKLRHQITLPECLRVVGVLRRIRAMDENSLRRVFLRSKETLARATQTQITDTTSDPYDSVKRVTDAHRVLVFDVVTQFRAIFATEEDETDEGDGFSDGGDYKNDDTKNERKKTLPSWCAFRTESFIHVLSKHVPLIDEGSRISAAFEHARYCSQSLARVGCDHRSLLLPIFSSAAFALFSEWVEVAVSDFERSAQTHRWSAFPSIGGASGGDSVRPAGFDDESKEKNASESSEQNQNKPPAPPAALAEHVLVGCFVNGILQSLNEIRHCVFSFPAIRKQCATEVHHALSRASKALVQVDTKYFNSNEADSSGGVAGNSSKRTAYVGACKALTTIAAPYVASCFGKTFGAVGEREVDARSAVEPLTKAMLGF